MAEIQESGDKKGKGSKQKKMSIRVDFTPMVDMNMLLITFFMLCTSLSKPQTMEISMPSNDKNITEEQQNKVKASQALTLLLDADNKLYYYEGEPDYDNYASLKETTYEADGLRKILLRKNADAVKKVRELKEKKARLEITEEECKKQIAEVKSGKNTPTVMRDWDLVGWFGRLAERLWRKIRAGGGTDGADLLDAGDQPSDGDDLERDRFQPGPDQ